MFKYKEFKIQKHFKDKCWYICRLVLQCLILAVIPAAFNSLIFFIATPIANSMGFTKPWTHLETEFDQYIPLVKVFIIPYLLIIVWWYIAPVLIFFINGQKQFYRFIIAQLTCAVIGLLFLIFLPTNCDNLRPQDDSKYSSNSVLDRMLRAVYSDNSNGAFPSFHVINTWTIFIITREKSEDNKRHWIFASVCGVFAVTTCLATLFVRQHWIVDVLAGIVIAELVFVVYRLHAKQYALQTFMTWLNQHIRLEPISQRNGVYNYQLVTPNQWRKYFVLYITLMLISLFLVTFFSIVYFYKITIP